MQKIQMILVGVVAVVVALAVGFGVSYFGLLGTKHGKIDSSTLETSFHDVAELTTEEYNFKAVGKYSDESGLWGFGKATFLVVYKGKVKAGVPDLSKIDAKIDGKNVVVTVPEVKVLDSTIDPSTIETYDQSFNPFNQIGPGDVANFLTAEADRAAEEAISGGLLERAKAQTESILTAQVRAIAGPDVSVSVTWAADS
ncbi:hypothetical protein HMPREF1531_01623 [Propionibacterium sp. oral taxon 192 str. F0372]|uniref:DUF4230 domain-containing protein n=1 Tax=Propionibacterium sp. oral taxon 192 TaxID=671222 RepID=UPI00035279BE|nr:DUF4230 domain-containing protein [Propionibacterium sp. oral taxon 192]EPH02317.1 hypothetical protein HMPREF1531_01623 [Propionibacterium sp. oral taxon 192 str. F0372]